MAFFMFEILNWSQFVQSLGLQNHDMIQFFSQTTTKEKKNRFESLSLFIMRHFWTLIIWIREQIFNRVFFGAAVPFDCCCHLLLPFICLKIWFHLKNFIWLMFLETKDINLMKNAKVLNCTEIWQYWCKKQEEQRKSSWQRGEIERLSRSIIWWKSKWTTEKRTWNEIKWNWIKFKKY